MKKKELENLLKNVSSGKITVAQALEKLKTPHIDHIGHARVDIHRRKRRGYPEVIYCATKTPEQVSSIIESLDSAGQNVLATRATSEMFDAAKKKVKRLKYVETAGMIVKRNEPVRKKGNVLVISAGTSDIPVAEEAAITAEEMGSRVVRAYDVGVAGIHRLLGIQDELKKARVVVAVAGMEGALPSVVSGLVSVPVIAVPTSVGYGASFGGITALLGMLNSCSAGVTVVNIDNGFGAGYTAHLINTTK